MNTTTYDAVIIGGGFAGLACARAMSRNGLHVTVLEKKPWPGCRPHTTGILVRELADSWNVPARLTRKITGIRVYSPDLRYIDLHSPGYYFLATDTPALLRWHAQQAIQAGVRLSYGVQYRGSRRQGPRHVLHGTGTRCRYLVGCDGARSRVAREYGLGINTEYLLGIEADFDEIPNLSRSHLHVFLDFDIANGYIAWIVPGVHTYQVGLAVRSPFVPSLDRFLMRIARLWNIDKKSITSIRSGLIPCGGLVVPYYSNDAMLLGDAAGMVSPLTAGGIYHAVNIGGIAGELIADHLLYQGENPGSALGRVLPRYLFKRGLRKIYNHLPFANNLFNGLIHAPAFRMIAQTIFYHQRGVFSVQAWRDIVRIGLNI